MRVLFLMRGDAMKFLILAAMVLPACGIWQEGGQTGEIMEEREIIEDPLALDEASPLGFSPNDALARIDTHAFDGVEVPSGNEYTAALVDHAPFIVTPTKESASATFRSEITDSETLESVWIRIPVSITSEDEAFATAGTLDIAATGVEAGQVAWTSWTHPYGAVGDMPAWATELLEAGTMCPENADVGPEDGRLQLNLDGPVENPILGLQIEWSALDVCQSIGFLDAVQLTEQL